MQTALGQSAAGTASCEAVGFDQYLAQAAPARSPYSKTPAKNWVTRRRAQYITPSDYSTAQEQTSANAFAAAAEIRPCKPPLRLSAATTNSGTGIVTVANVAIMYASWKAWAMNHGVNKMCGYEGGYSPDYTGSATLDALRSASKQAPVLTTITAQNYANFVNLTDANFSAEFPSCFQLSGLTLTPSAWSVLEDIYQSPNPPQWVAIVAFNQAK